MLGLYPNGPHEGAHGAAQIKGRRGLWEAMLNFQGGMWHMQSESTRATDEMT